MREAPSASTAAAAMGLERAINAALALDPVSLGRIATLAGNVIAIDCSMPRWRLYVLPNERGVEIRTWHEAKADCAVSGAASEYVAVAAAADKPSALVNGGLRIHGDSNVLLDLGNALSGLDLDWESRLALLLGDIPAHQIGRLVRGSVRWGRAANDSLLRHIEEFVHEEARLAPPRLEVEDFLADVRALAQDTDRAQARARRLARRMEALLEQSSRSAPSGRG